MILFHKFFSESETAAFVRHGHGRYEKSLGVGIKEDGTMGDVKTEIRTSSHGWCQHPACLNDPDVQRVVARVADLTQTPATNAEFAQLVYYHACSAADDPSCAFYRRHNDYIDGDEHRLQGVRIYTLFGYMNDVPEGGGTRFTSLPTGPVTFQPQRGKAILWPSVLADDPHTKDERTDHEALPVTKGEKFGVSSACTELSAVPMPLPLPKAPVSLDGSRVLPVRRPTFGYTSTTSRARTRRDAPQDEIGTAEPLSSVQAHIDPPCARFELFFSALIVGLKPPCPSSQLLSALVCETATCLAVPRASDPPSATALESRRSSYLFRVLSLCYILSFLS